MVEVKFCGLTREEDASEAARLGAEYVGAIFVGGPRAVAPPRARALFDASRGCARAVGVFGTDFRPGGVETIVRSAADARVAIVQLHGDPGAAEVRSLRERFDGPIWAVVRVVRSELPAWTASVFASADAVVLDARVDGGLGGSGVALDWAALADSLAELRGGARLVLAGGLRPDNVATAVRLLSPDVVDVSSGVESAPGIKDHDKMHAFLNAAREQG